MRWRPALALILGGTLAGYVGLRPPAPSVAPADQPAQLTSRYTWHLDANWFGGFSGFELQADGASFLALTDSAHLVAGRIDRDNAGHITGLTATWDQPLLDSSGRRFKGNRQDAEGLALRPDGQFYVSFEHFPRVLYYAHPGALGLWARHHPPFDGLISNKALEAVAIDDLGRVLTMPEKPTGDATTIQIYRLDDPTWRDAFTLPRDPRFQPVGADFGPGGRLYVLERDVYPFGFRSRVRALTLSGDRVLADETVLQTPLGTHDNLEGIAVWRDQQGRIRLTMISDDNFLPLQITEIVEYTLTE